MMTRNTKFDSSLNIVPGKSIGGISLGDNVDEIILSLGENVPFETFEFENFGTKYRCYRLTKEGLSFTTDEQGKIIALWCEPSYNGRFNGRLYPGITAKELRAVTRKQILVKGYLVVDDIYNLYFGMPDDIDDFNSFSDIDDDACFNELYVGDLK
ncbi:hypothetical protein [Mangrovibacter yixingensis]|uniref:hypothetical protein n=1 Tax=Mangrovibacter yixingensis TaxID=1529639 RepID=UPI001CFDB753|nr:hypothetical protein [Mangrovibacter yixingensis]